MLLTVYLFALEVQRVKVVARLASPYCWGGLAAPLSAGHPRRASGIMIELFFVVMCECFAPGGCLDGNGALQCRAEPSDTPINRARVGACADAVALTSLRFWIV